MPFLPNLPWTEIGEQAKAPEAVVVLPVASIEQHGPHLPLFTDTLIGEALALRIDEGELPILRLPALCYGKSNEHIHFPGTITLSTETLLRVLDEVSASIARAGFSRLILLNTHGGNTALLTAVARDIHMRYELMVATLNPMASLCTRWELNQDEARYGIHAGYVETSVMLALHPELVRTEVASGKPPDLFKSCKYLDFAGANTVAWLASDLSEHGALGDPSGANAEAGEQYLKEAIEVTRGALEEFSKLSFPADRKPHVVSE